MSDVIQDQDPKLLLNALAGIKRLMQDRAIELRHSRGTSKILTDLEIVHCSNGNRLESYFDMMSENGHWLGWSIDVQWDREHWTINAEVYKGTKSSGQDSVIEFPEKVATSLQEFLSILKQTTEDLLAFDLSTVEVMD